MKYVHKDRAFYAFGVAFAAVVSLLVGMPGCVPAEGNPRGAPFGPIGGIDSIPHVIRIDSMGFYTHSDSFIPLALLGGDSVRIVYVFCHAEEDTLGLNPGLSERGAMRARILAEVMTDAVVGSILTPPFRRTYLSARPLAEVHGLEPILFEPEDPGSFLRLLLQAPAPLVIITTEPHLAELRTFFQLPEPPHACYDLCYVVALRPDLHLQRAFVFRFGPSVMLH